ncbi:MAG: hypothetical protein Q8Q05_00135 [bacterium]|nr:hypothetical protein [bacterium]
MRRFVVGYLTTSVVIIFLANLALVVLYVRQFDFHAQALVDCLPNDCQGNNVLTDFIVLNSILAGLLLIIWWIVRKLHSHQSAHN